MSHPISANEVRDITIRNGGRITDGLRSGQPHRRSDSVDGNRFNSTSNNSQVVQQSSMNISSIDIPEPPTDNGLHGLDLVGTFMETPVGYGSGTIMSQVHESRTQDRSSVDSITEPVSIQDDINGLEDQVERFGLEHINEIDWQNSIESEFRKLDEKLMKFISMLGLVGKCDFLTKARSLRTTLQNHRQALWRRVRDDKDNPVFSKVNLTSRFAKADERSHSTDTFTSLSSDDLSSDTLRDGATGDQSNDAHHTTIQGTPIRDGATGDQSNVAHHNTIQGVPSTQGGREIHENSQIDDNVFPETLPPPLHPSPPTQGQGQQQQRNEIPDLEMFSLSQLFADIPCPEFMTNPEVINKVEKMDTQIHALVKELRTDIKANKDEMTKWSSKMKQLSNAFSTQSQRITTVTNQLNAYITEQDSFRHELVAIKLNSESVSGFVSDIKTGVEALVSKYEHTVKADDFEKIKKSVNDVVDISRNNENMVEVLKIQALDQRKKYKQIIQSLRAPLLEQNQRVDASTSVTSGPINSGRTESTLLLAEHPSMHSNQAPSSALLPPAPTSQQMCAQIIQTLAGAAVSRVETSQPTIPANPTCMARSVIQTPPAGITNITTDQLSQNTTGTPSPVLTGSQPEISTCSADTVIQNPLAGITNTTTGQSNQDTTTPVLTSEQMYAQIIQSLSVAAASRAENSQANVSVECGPNLHGGICHTAPIGKYYEYSAYSVYLQGR